MKLVMWLAAVKPEYVATRLLLNLNLNEVGDVACGDEGAIMPPRRDGTIAFEISSNFSSLHS